MHEKLIGFSAVCNGTRFESDSLACSCDGVFEVTFSKTESEGIRLISPVVKNTSPEMIRFQRAMVRVELPNGPFEMYAQQGTWARESRGAWAPMAGRNVVLTNVQGRTTEGNTPFTAFRMLGCRDGLSLHVLPVGNWCIRTGVSDRGCTGNEPPVHVLLGISDFTLNYALAPGESWQLPAVIIQPFADFSDTSGSLHKFVMKNLGISRKIPPIEYNTWLDRYDHLDVDHLRRELAVVSKAGCEVFVIDAGWFGADGIWADRVGDWRESTTKAFCGKMKDFANEVRAAGLGFGLWIEPERYMNHVPTRLEHPEWFVSTGYENNRLDLENPDAYDYLKSTFLRLIDTYGLAYIKTDMNGWLAQDETGSEHNRYARLFYKLIDEVRTLRPAVFLECCASGAMRNDLEATRHFDALFCSDNSNAFDVNDNVVGDWQRLLPGQMLRWAVLRQVEATVPGYGDAPDFSPVIAPCGGVWYSFECVDLKSLLAANFMCGMYGFSACLASLSDENLEIVARYISLFKEKREMMRQAVGYVLIEQPELKVLEMVQDGNAAILVQTSCFDRRQSICIYPKDLAQEVTYVFNGISRSGRDIMQNGIELPLKSHESHLRRFAELFFLEAEKR